MPKVLPLIPEDDLLIKRLLLYMKLNFYTILYRSLIFTAIFLAGCLIIALVSGYNRFSADYQVRFELPFKNWIVIEPRTSAAKPFFKQAKAKEVEKSKTYTVSQIVDAVHILESSGGRKDGCVVSGKGVNGFGFAQHDDHMTWDCFKNYKGVRTRVEQWFTNKLQTMTLPQALCYYNLGKPKGILLNDCTYYQNFLKVIES